MRFDWTDLQVFLQVCEAGSMTRAATRCHLTLAAVSAWIRNLEEVNAIALLVRHARGVSPTAAGEVLARHARTVLDQVQRLDRELLHAQNGEPRRTVLLANSSALAGPLGEAIAQLLAPVAERPLLVRESASEATVQALRSGSADVGIVSDAVETRGLLARELAPDPLVLAVPRKHPLAARTSVPFAEALAQPWVAWGEFGALSTHLQMHALALGARIQAQTTFPTVDGVLRLVAAGVGITVLPQSVLGRQTDAEAVASVTLEEPWAKRRLLVCRQEGGDALRRRLAEEIAKRWQQGEGQPIMGCFPLVAVPHKTNRTRDDAWQDRGSRRRRCGRSTFSSQDKLVSAARLGNWLTVASTAIQYYAVREGARATVTAIREAASEQKQEARENARRILDGLADRIGNSIDRLGLMLDERLAIASCRWQLQSRRTSSPSSTCRSSRRSGATTTSRTAPENMRTSQPNPTRCGARTCSNSWTGVRPNPQAPVVRGHRPVGSAVALLVRGQHAEALSATEKAVGLAPDLLPARVQYVPQWSRRSRRWTPRPGLPFGTS